MITITNSKKAELTNFWNHAVFHPTDAVEDAWGRRILDTASEDRALRTVRVYTMFEDIVYLDEHDVLCFDFRLNDLRLDYLLGAGYDLMLAYAFMPDCIAKNRNALSTVSKNPTRYKGKRINTSVPTEISLWEEVCYQYTRHLVERYGEETVASWRLQCFNEPDIPQFFLSDQRGENVNRLEEYCKLYRAFASGIRRASTHLCIGGPALACDLDFLAGFLADIKAHGTQLDFVSFHCYGTSPSELRDGNGVSVQQVMEKLRRYDTVITASGFADTERILDEWGACSCGFCNREDNPELLFRESEVFSSYYVKLLHRLIKSELPISKMMICLSGQHEMTEDFSGFRGFFTLNHIRKPIYNAFVLAARLGGELLSEEHDSDLIDVIPTRHPDGSYAVLLTYASERFGNLPKIRETIRFPEDIIGKHLRVYCIDHTHTNPYTLFTENHMGSTLSRDEIRLLRNEGTLKPILDTTAESAGIGLTLSANVVILITAENA